MTAVSTPDTRVRVRVEVTGVVQGVGFRPAVARIANHHNVSGFVCNDRGAVRCELEGDADAVVAAVEAIRTRPPPMARIDAIRLATLAPMLTPQEAASGFHIVAGGAGAGAGANEPPTLIPPDLATCRDCLRELFDPADRRYGHPFITCVNCGPRYTVITGLPYDRPRTTMAGFPMCAACAAEYRDPGDRRYHAQTVACPGCGPTLWWRGPGDAADPMAAAAAAIMAGSIVALKGIGGYHLACRADDDIAVATLRERKNRPAKPFAVMVANLEAARAIADIGADMDVAAARALNSAAAPIVLLPRRAGVVDGVAPGLRDLGVLLAYSPVHHLLFARVGPVPLVLTSANRGGSPIVHRDDDTDRIAGIADGVLGHDRPIHVPCEDSAVTVTPGGGTVAVRRSRGFAPLPVPTEMPTDVVVLGAGGDVKTVACLLDRTGRGHLSPHLGDMTDVRTQDAFESVVNHLAAMTAAPPGVVACDMHPRYATAGWARRSGLPTVPVQHHHAHAVALLAEHRRLGTPIVAVVYDGTGYGADGTIWGGELLALNETARFTRVGHVKQFSLPGGEGALRHPARIALDLLFRAGAAWDAAPAPVQAVGADGLRILAQQIPRGIGCVPTTSMGRLFDAVASLLGVCQEVTYEGQAAVELERLARSGHATTLNFSVADGVLDPAPLIVGLVEQSRAGVHPADLAAGFHAAVIRATAHAASSCARAAGITTIGLTGGVFANELLTDGLRETLTDGGFEVLTHETVPCNDGGLALGQAVVAAALLGADSERRKPCASEYPAR